MKPAEYQETSRLVKYYELRNVIAHPEEQDKKACLSHITVLSENAQLTLTMARKIKTQLAIKDKSRYTTSIQYEDRPSLFIDARKTVCSLAVIGLYEACQVGELKNYRNSAAHPNCTRDVLKTYLDYYFKDSEVTNSSIIDFYCNFFNKRRKFPVLDSYLSYLLCKEHISGGKSA